MSSPLDFRAAAPVNPMGIQIAPLIDVVFLLICFFMFATQLMQTHSDASVKVPVISSDRATAESPAEIIVNVRRDGSLRVNSTEMNAGALTAFLAKETVRQANRSDPLRVVIRADRRQQFDGLDKAMESCRRAGITQLILRAAPEDEP